MAEDAFRHTGVSHRSLLISIILCHLHCHCCQHELWQSENPGCIATLIKVWQLQAWWKKKYSGVDGATDSSHLVDQVNKSDGNIPSPVIAATFTHSILIESMSAITFLLFLHLIVIMYM